MKTEVKIGPAKEVHLVILAILNSYLFAAVLISLRSLSNYPTEISIQNCFLLGTKPTYFPNMLKRLPKPRPIHVETEYAYLALTLTEACNHSLLE
jgi:hypothetical protein